MWNYKPKSRLKILSVKEDNYQSDRLTVAINGNSGTHISVLSNGGLIIRQNGKNGKILVEIKDLNLDDLIEYLSEAKEFLSEQKLFDTIKALPND